MPPEKPQWAELYDEVVTSGLCTGCAGCVIACPHDVLGYDDTNGVYKPFHLEAERRPGGLRARRQGLHHVHPGLPRFRTVGARDRRPTCSAGSRTADEVAGVSKDIVLARATDPELHEVGPGRRAGLGHPAVRLEHDVIDAALVSLPGGRRHHLEGDPRRGPHPRRGPGRGRLPLHLLGQHPGLRRGRREAAPSASRWSA